MSSLKFSIVETEDSILEKAEELVMGDRGVNYGHPIVDFSRTAKIWTALKDVEFSASDVAKFMIAVKLSRETNNPKRDNRVDIAGYALTLDMVEEYEQF
tara:strand:- start:333 stop:629 length:297 start_codon:yes stop_codon:yes gene_type:complete